MSTFMISRKTPALNRFNDLDRFFEALWQPHAGVVAGPAGSVDEGEEHYLLSLEVPGVPKDQIQIEVAEDVLSVSGEGRRGKFSRSFTLPQGVDASKIEARTQDGVLEIYVPKAETTKPRQIKISDGGGGFFSKLLGKKEQESQPSQVA